MKGLPLLSKTVYKRLRVCTTGRNLPVQKFLDLKKRLNESSLQLSDFAQMFMCNVYFAYKV